VILQWILKNKKSLECKLDLTGSGCGPVADSYEHENELAGYIREGVGCLLTILTMSVWVAGRKVARKRDILLKCIAI
jgi:hypothetical protein